MGGAPVSLPPSFMCLYTAPLQVRSRAERGAYEVRRLTHALRHSTALAYSRDSVLYDDSLVDTTLKNSKFGSC